MWSSPRAQTAWSRCTPCTAKAACPQWSRRSSPADAGSSLSSPRSAYTPSAATMSRPLTGISTPSATSIPQPTISNCAKTRTGHTNPCTPPIRQLRPECYLFPRHTHGPQQIDLGHPIVALRPRQVAPGLYQVQLGIIHFEPDLDAEFIALLGHLHQPFGLLDCTGQGLD